MNDNYDIAIIGGGPAGIFAAYELISLNPHTKIIMIEEGLNIYDRKCPIAEKRTDHCVQCKPCSIMRGFGGAGAFSDGKFNFTTQFGGWLIDYIPEEQLMALIDYADEINMKYGAPAEYFSTKNSKVRKQALAHDLHLLDAKVRHLGTKNYLKILGKMYEFLKERITILFNAHVSQFQRVSDHFTV